MLTHRERLIEFHKANLGVIQAQIFRCDHALALLLGMAASSALDLLIMRSVGQWMGEMQRRKKHNSFLCLDCDTEFYGRQEPPEAFLILTPFAATTSYPLMTGICRRCIHQDDAALRTAALKLLQTIYPKATSFGQPGHA